MSDTAASTKRRPIAGGLWGIPLGLGLALIAIDRRIVSLSIGTAIALVVAGVVIGALWGSFGPAKTRVDDAGPEQATAEPSATAVAADDGEQDGEPGEAGAEAAGSVADPGSDDGPDPR